VKESERRVRGDLIQMYKVLNGLEEIDWTRDPKQNFTRNTYEKRENFGNSSVCQKKASLPKLITITVYVGHKKICIRFGFYDLKIYNDRKPIIDHVT
jgi:hypothetical protein